MTSPSANIPAPMCVFCQRLGGYPECEAFPTGIPAAIKNSQYDHRVPYVGDGGLQFLAIKSEERKASRYLKDLFEN